VQTRRKPERVTVDADDMDDGSDDMEWESTSAPVDHVVTVPQQSLSQTPQPVPKKKKRKKKPAVNGHMQSLLNKWQAVKQVNQAEEDEAANALEAKLNPALAQKKLQKDISKWKKEMLQSGHADHNPNFHPVGDDWRAKVARARAAKKAKASHL
jgi:hypothetical protein